MDAMDTKDNIKELFTDAIQQVQMAIKQTAAYPGDHPISRQIFYKSYETLTDLLNKQDTLTFGTFGGKMLVDNVPIDGKNSLFDSFAKYLNRRDIDSITFYHGLSQKDFTFFLDAMIKRPGIITREGGVASILNQHRVSTIKLNGITYGKIAEESKYLENAYIINYLSGENDSLGDHSHTFLQILENDPRRISDLIMQVTEAKDSAVDPHNQVTRAKAAFETMSRVATELVGRQGASWDQFKETITSILSSCEEDMLLQMSQAMEVREGEKDEIIDGLVGEFFYDAVADICVNEYRQSRQFDLKFVEGLIPSTEERKRLSNHLNRKLKEYGTLGEEKIISELFCEEPEVKEKTIHHRDVSSDGERKSIKDDISRLLSKGKSDEVNDIIRDLSKKLDDTSWRIREKVAESLLEVTSVLDECNKLKEHFRDMSEALIRRVKQENYSDIYLIVSENLHRMCTSQNRIDSYLTNETLGSRLFEANKLSKDQLQKALMARKKNGKSLQYNLGAFNYVDESVLTHFLAQQYRGCQTVHLSEIYDIPKNILKAVPVKFIRDHLILPFRLNSGNLHTATMNPNALNIFNDIRFISGYSVVPFLASEYHLLNAIKRFYHIATLTPESNRIMKGEDDLEFFDEKEKEVTATEELKDSDAPVVRLVNLIIKSAITQKASDIHIEPFEDEMRIRFRVDGTLTTVLAPSIDYVNGVTSRIKIMARLDISERRLPQDGRFKISVNGHYVDFRVSTFPGVFGEKVALRLLDSSILELNINNLGLNSKDLTPLLTAMYKSKGMILVTGPTGSGKTTTLYSVLQGLNDGSRNISTAEDPIEYNLKGINQFQMYPKIGLNFARALRTLLRQDPDIIMVGEIRDFETAEIAVKAALTGHIVLSTLHTNSAPETIARLLDMGIEPYLLISSLNLIVAQRLMRKICPSCKTGASPNDLQLKVLASYGLDISGHQFFIGEGCGECNNTGYRGRVAVFEIMPIWQEIQELILQEKSSIAIREKAINLGLVTLQEQGFNKVIEGITSLDEWMRTAT